MKHFFLLFLILIPIAAFSQSIEKSILLKDAITDKPIEDATVYVIKTKQTLLSNADGKVTFELKGGSSIQITHTSYVISIVRSTLLKEKVTTVYLKSNVTDLDELVFTKQHPQKILKNLIENSKKKLTAPGRLKIYSREFFKLNGNYSYYTDGLLNFQIFSKSRKFDTNILVEQNRSYGLQDAEVKADLLGYNLNNIMENYYNFKYLNRVLDPKSKTDFDFLIKIYSKNKDYNIMTIKPSENAKGLLDDFSIIYDSEKKLIIEVTADLSAAAMAKVEDKVVVGSKNVFKSEYKTIYRVDDDLYYLLSSKEEVGFEKVEKKGTKKIEVRNYLVTTNFSNQNYSFKANEVFKDKTLFNKKNTILTDYWKLSGLTPSDEEQEIIKHIEDTK
jgi:hypothetical protein